MFSDPIIIGGAIIAIAIIVVAAKVQQSRKNKAD